MLDEDQTAAAVAPEIDRLRLAAMNGSLRRGLPPEVIDAGLDQASGMLLAYLRNAWPDREVARSSVHAVFTYQPDRPVDALLDVLCERGLIEEPVPERIRLRPLGRDAVGALHRTSAETVDELWAGALDHVTAAAPLVARVLDDARATAGAASALMAPQDLPGDLSASAVLAEQLTGLRFHRFDSHIAAWRAMGLGVGDLAGLDEERRTRLEVDTDRRAGVPYAGLSGTERSTLLDHLAALPGDAPSTSA
jgi:hypothetical protein